MEHESDSDTNSNWCTWYSLQRIGTETDRLGNKRTNWEHPISSFIRISQNTEKWRLEETRCHSISCGRPSAYVAEKNSQRNVIILIIMMNISQNSKSMLCWYSNEMVYHIIRESSKLEENKYKTRHDWVGKVIHWELCRRLKFDHTNIWYMHEPKSILENKT